MDTLEVLCATMHQRDFSLAEKMNIQTCALFANQSNDYCYSEIKTEYGIQKMITTSTRGVGCNRNIALLHANADILLFADDDVRYVDGYAGGVLRAFREIPNADVLIFGIDKTKAGKIICAQRHSRRRLHCWNAMKYGTYCIAARRNSLVRKNIHFTTLFGGGCLYGSGEDSLFLLDCFRKGFKVYSHPYVLGSCAKDTSTWFAGYNKKFFYDKGAWIAAAFPVLKHLIKWYFGIHFIKKTDLSFRAAMTYINAGLKGYRNLVPYCENNTEAYK